MENDIWLEQLYESLEKAAEQARKMARAIREIFSLCAEYEEAKPKPNQVYISQHKHPKTHSPKTYSASIKVSKNLPYMRRNY